ncbi:hypothetical protein CXF83_00570 [Shewanella sp. Choline-02u-19]|uniref:hypothetical protein n=1 Tax=unclassified Shewanella TaxID=196818 RepID=UPI000C33570F|nr:MULTISPECIES: hypothetical protein [unclassified Shewanella]PKH56023.1 hypothetical protein CXF84_15265 [Shewanella sp. Bg11-22]PKI30612.1 hypothetical protein CXF83_00570 [Shewanella sp. Choline-02u-19]
MTLNSLLNYKFGNNYPALILEAFIINFFVLFLFVFIWGGESNVGAFVFNISNIVTAIFIVPLLETIIFFIVLPYVLYAFDMKAFNICIICSSAFSFSHSPDVAVFYIFYFLFGWYLSVCSSKFVFSSGSMLRGAFLVFFMHAIWNLIILSISYFIG